ncbi:extracellular solute-binding protein [Infirmifilum uzonense]|uniref:extracellular solute-binding protein n=1 Tax=Infirmifilum uzonense TaxID=1550241 RepID=UPI003C781830
MAGKKKLLALLPIALLFLSSTGLAAQLKNSQLNLYGQQYENTLVFITPSNKNLLNAIIPAFQKYAKEKLGVDVKVQLIQVGSPEAMNRIIAWGGKPDADIFFGGDLIYHWKVKAQGLLERYKPNSPYYDRLPSVFMGFPLKDPDEMWHPKLWWGHGPMYNLEVLNKFGLQPPKTWEELLDPKWKDLIVMCTPSRSSSTFINVAVIMQREGLDKGWAFWRQLAANVGTFVQRSADVVELVQKGEYAVGFTYSQGAIFAKAQGYPVGMYMDPTGFIVSGVSLLKGAPHPNIAKAFLDWWYTPDAQQAALSAGGIPVLPDVKIDGPPGSPAAILKEFLGGKDTIYDYLQSFKNVQFYNFTFAESIYNQVAKEFDDTIVAKHNELKDAWATILDAKTKVAGVPQAEAKLQEAIQLFNKGNYAQAKSIALEAVNIAAAAPKGPSATDIALYIVIAIVIVGAAYYVYSQRKKKSQKQ